MSILDCRLFEGPRLLEGSEHRFKTHAFVLEGAHFTFVILFIFNRGCFVATEGYMTSRQEQHE